MSLHKDSTNIPREKTEIKGGDSIATIRVIKNKDFTVMSNVHLRDKRLSLKAVGLLSKLLSLRDDWRYSVKGLEKICKERRDAISAALKELEECGYLVRYQTHDEGGSFGAMEYLVYEVPQNGTAIDDTDLDEAEELTVDGKSVNGEDECASPLPDLPFTENPFTENPSTELNIKYIKYLNKSNIPPIVPHEGDGATGSRKRKRHRAPPKEQPDHLPARFNSLWEYYRHDKRGGKQAAIRAWDALAPSDALADKIAAAMKKQFATAEWQRGIGIPHVSTYLNGSMWMDADEIDEAPPGNVSELNTGGDREWI